MEATLIKPTVGEGATISLWADSHPQTIIEVSSDLKTVTVQQDSAKVDPNAKPYANKWIVEKDPQGQVQVFTLRKNGRYVRKGESLNGQALSLGGRHKYYSYEF
jgi:phage gp46-like protein